MPGKITLEAAVSLALSMMVNWLSENCVPLPLKTRVWARLGVTTIIPGVFPAEIGAKGPRVSFRALTTYTPADEVKPDVTLFEIKARYARPLVFEELEELPPQLS